MSNTKQHSEGNCAYFIPLFLIISVSNLIKKQGFAERKRVGINCVKDNLYLLELRNKRIKRVG